MKVSKIQAVAPFKIEYFFNNNEEFICNENEVVVENIYSHISSGTELACIAGQEDWFQFPSTLGYTSVGKIINKNSSVKNLDVGDFVYTFGPHTSHFKINITDRWHGVCVKIPKNNNLKLAAFTHMAGIAITALRQSKIEVGDWVAISGLGTIGNLCAQLCKLQGAKVIGIDILEKRIETAKQCNIDYTINSASSSLEEEILKITENQKVNTFIDASGIPAVVEHSAKLISQYGELILLGSPRNTYNTNITAFLQHIHLWSHGAINVKGALEFIYPTHQTEFCKHSIERNSKIILELIETKKLIIEPLLSKIAKPATASETYENIKQFPEDYMGVLFDWQN